MASKGFKPDAKTIKMLATRGARAYIYRDGVCVVENRPQRALRSVAAPEVWHFWPCQIALFHVDYSKSNRGIKGVNYVRVDEAASLIAGVDRVQVSFRSTSTTSEGMGLSFTNVLFRAPSGMIWRDVTANNVASGQVEVIPNPDHHAWNGECYDPKETLLALLRRCAEDGDKIKWHGEQAALEAVLA